MQNSSRRLRDEAEERLVREAQQGSVEAFAELVRRSRWRMLCVAGAILRSREDAEDAVQVACWNAFRRLSTFRGESCFNTWLTSITVNQARMRRRELTRAGRILAEDSSDAALWVADPAPDAEQRYASEELVDALHREMRRLPAQLRQAMLAHVQSSSAAELAGRLGVSLAAAKARLFRARLHLHQRMKPYAAPREAAA